jgi:hypothetical protein
VGAPGSAGGLGIGGAGGFGADDGGGGGGGLFGGGGGGGGNTAGGGGGGGGSSLGPSGAAFSQDTSGTPSVTITPDTALVAVSSPSLSFGTQPQSTVSLPQTITLSSVGFIPLSITDLSFGGANPDDFLIGSSTCGGPIAPGAGCTVTVRFVPAAKGARAAALEIASNDKASPAIVALSGIGGQPPAGPAGKIELVTCTTTTKTVVRHGHKTHPKVTKCKGKLVSGSVKFTNAGNATRAKLTRGRVTYATGRSTSVRARRWQMILTPTRRLKPGRYTLTLRRRGRPARHLHVTLG